MGERLQQCTTNLKVMGLNLAHTCVCGIRFPVVAPLGPMFLLRVISTRLNNYKD